MSKKRNWTQTAIFAFGISMSVLMAASLILPALQQNTVQAPEQDALEPTATPAPEYPDPLTDFSGISFDGSVYLHPTGIFTVPVPTGWEPTQPFNTASQVQANMNNPDQLSIIESYIQTPITPITSLEDLSAVFTFNTLASSWARYTNWEELSRELDEENNQLKIDFRLARGNQNFFAQHVAWYDEDFVYVTRVVAPENATELLFYMVENMAGTIEVLPQFRDTPLGFSGYFDDANEQIIRYPQAWRITDSAPGLTSIEGEEVAVRVEVQDDLIADEDAARAYTEALRPDVAIASVESVSRNGGEGFSVAYNYRTPDGAGRSGLVVLLNGEDEKLHVANAVVEATNVDLNADEIDPAYTDVVNALNTFSLLRGLNLYEPPAPELPPVIETTPEVTVEPTEEAEVTPEATEESVNDAETTPEAEDAG